ncbi:MAG: MBL fold metallo-hydrolase [Thermoplasmata archaeon]
MGYSVHRLNGVGLEANAYLLECRRPLLIDVGTGARLDELLRELRAILGDRRLELLALTHMHFDHTGGAASLQEATGAEAIAHPPDSSALADGDGEMTCAFWLGESQRPVLVREVREGEKIELGDATLEVLHTPGHSAGSMALFDRRSRSLFSGDTVFTGGGVGRCDLPTGNAGQLIASLERLLSLGVRNLYPGHGPCAEGDGSAHIELGLRMARSLF